MPNYRALVAGGFYSADPYDRSMPVSIRCNNPGAVNGAGWEKQWPGYVTTDVTTPGNATTIFEAPEYGVAVWWELMRLYRAGGTTTLQGIITRYGGGQDYSAYVLAVARWSGLPVGQAIDLADDTVLLPFAKAMFRYEAGRETPLSDAQILFGFAIGRAGGKVAADPAGAGLKPAPATDANYADDFAAQIVAAMRAKGYTVAAEPGCITIAYVEGCDPPTAEASARANGNDPNAFDDLRCVIRFEAGKPRLAGCWEATTHPGRYYVEHPINELGGAHIQLGQHRAWQVGLHRGKYEALVQTGGEVAIVRSLDPAKDFARNGVVTSGYYGINQHHGDDMPKENIGRESAGCLVGHAIAGHREFMALVKSDPRYQADKGHVFDTAVMPVRWVLKHSVALPSPRRGEGRGESPHDGTGEGVTPSPQPSPQRGEGAPPAKPLGAAIATLLRLIRRLLHKEKP